ncbi:hypothetical protein GCM10020331_043910 [Ectobacillus funiculus]
MNLPRIHVRSKDETSEIAEAFNELTHALEENRKQEMAFKQALQEQNWLETSAAEIATMYQGVHDLRTLTGMFLTKKIVPMIDASYGAFFILNKEQAHSSVFFINLPPMPMTATKLVGRALRSEKA